MERFWSAFSVTFLLSSLAAVGQIQPAPYSVDRQSVDRPMQNGFSVPESKMAMQMNAILKHTELPRILVQTFQGDRLNSEVQ
ncbi:MAG: hypothetical protein HC772_00485 [Leptolyngbyaceae cyanobacterium CRU_2_3]|nr:hypothetical protein [Leptolyngbyaceae cyanobacterium CRU_2_3]